MMRLPFGYFEIPNADNHASNAVKGVRWFQRIHLVETVHHETFSDPAVVGQRT